MTRRLLILSLSTLILGLVATAQPDKKNDSHITLGVAFYNVENLFDTINSNGKFDQEFSPQGAKKWDSDKYRAKLNNIAYAIYRMATDEIPEGPALLGVAEVENRAVLDDLVGNELIKERNLQIVHHDSPDRRGIDVALLYDPQRFEVQNVTNHRLHVASDPSLLTRDMMCVTGLLAGEEVAVMVNHWPSRLGGQQRSAHLRNAAAALCLHIADSLWNTDPDRAIIIMGDLNDDPQDPSCSQVLGAKRERRGVESHGFFNPFWKTLDNGTGSLAYRGSWNLFDQIIISGNLLNKGGLIYLGHKVLNFDFLTNLSGKYEDTPRRTFAGTKFLNGYSDHYPTIIYLTKRSK